MNPVAAQCDIFRIVEQIVCERAERYSARQEEKQQA